MKCCLSLGFGRRLCGEVQEIVRCLGRHDPFPRLHIYSRNKKQSREGINRGNRKKEQEIIEGKHILETAYFPSNQNLILLADNLPINRDVNTDLFASTNFDAFEFPQLLIKTSWQKREGRFQARLVERKQPINQVLCSQSYISVHLPLERQEVLMAACLAYNGSWANYFLLLISGRFAFDRSEPLSEDLRSLPLPLWNEHDTLTPQSVNEFRALLEADRNGNAVSLEQIDEAVFRAFEFQKSERILIEDLVQFTLSGFKERGQSPSYRPTVRRSEENDEPDLRRYCETLMETLAHAYGADKSLGVRIWSENEVSDAERLPMRYVSVTFDVDRERGLQIQPLENRALRQRILELHRQLQNGRENEGYSRQVREYTPFDGEHEGGLVLNILKPDLLRYWTRSAALRDADDIARDFWSWQNAAEAAGVEGASC